MTFHWLLVLFVVPLVGAVAVMLLPKDNADAGQAGSASRLAARLRASPLVMALQFVVADAAELPVRVRLRLDPGVRRAASRSASTASRSCSSRCRPALVPVVLLAGWDDADGARGSVKGYFALILVLEAAMIGVFAATDVFLFYVFFEAMLIPVYFLIGRYGGPRRNYAAVKFLLYSLFGGLLMLAVADRPVRRVAPTCSARAPSTSPRWPASTSTASTQKWLFVGFFVAFAIKAPLVPFHTWLPDAAAESTPGTAVLLVGVLDKVGTFGMLRYCLRAVPRRLALGDAAGASCSRSSASSTARCWRSARPTSSGSSPTPRCRTSASSRSASSR